MKVNSKMRETALYARLKPKFTAWGAHSRVENTIESGTWDVFYCFNGVMGWIETKMDKGGDLYFEKFQIPWGRRYHSEGATQMFVMAGVGVGKDMKVYHVGELVKAPTRVHKKWTVVNIADMTPCLEMERPYRWDVLRTLLITPFPETT